MANLRIPARPVGALRSLRAPRRTHTPAAYRCYATELEPERPKTPRAGNETKLGRSFQGQVMGSIGHRLQREREQRAQYEKWRYITDPGRNWSATICRFYIRAAPLTKGRSHELTIELSSRPGLRRNRLLPRNILAARAGTELDTAVGKDNSPEA